MAIQKKHKIYAGLVGAALAAWGIDAAFFGGGPVANPAPASAAVPPAPSPPRGVGVEASRADAQADRRDDAWLAARLRAWAAENPPGASEVRDVFRPSDAWATELQGRRAAPAAAPAPADGASAAAEFARSHRLTAVVLTASGAAAGGGGGSAVIDGRLLRVGQAVGGCTLVGVRAGSADLLSPAGDRFRVVIGAGEAGTDPK